MEDISKLRIVFFLLISAVTPFSHSKPNVIKSLPGFPCILPFSLETGYIGVGKNEEVQLFYYFCESERDVEADSLLLWLTGGPGCSAFSGLVFEIGPLTFNYSDSNFQTSSPKLQLNPHSWTKVASIIFLDSPVGSGFSYGTTTDAYYSDDILQSQHIYEFLRKWLMEHPKFKENPFYVSGDSYVGLIVPIVVKEILNGNQRRLLPEINMKSAKAYCNDDFANIDANNTKCLESFQQITELTNNVVNRPHVLEHKCVFVSPRPPNFLNNKFMLPKQHCRGTIEYWVRCNRNLPAYTKNVQSVISYHKSFTRKFLRALIYSGDQDLSVPYVDSLEWIKQLNLSIDVHWRPWFVDGQVAGFVTEYKHFPYRLTFSTIKRGGHTAPENKPREALAMIDRWLGLSFL